MENVLITGGCGFIGCNLIPLLLSSGSYRVKVLDNEVIGKREHIDTPGVEFFLGDIRNKDDVMRAMRDIDVVVHLAADTRVMDSIENPLFNFENNVVGTFNILNSMRELGIKKIISASTGGAIVGEAEPPVHEGMVPCPSSPYGATKLALEGYCSAFSDSYGMQTVCLRFSNVYGPRSFHKGSVVAAFFKKILSGEALEVFGDGSQTRDYVFVDDVCRGIVQSLKSDVVGVFQLGTGIPTSINELIEAVKEVTSKKVEVKYNSFREGEIINTYCDISKASESFSYSPSCDLRSGLDSTWKWFMSS